MQRNLRSAKDFHVNAAPATQIKQTLVCTGNPCNDSVLSNLCDVVCDVPCEDPGVDTSEHMAAVLEAAVSAAHAGAWGFDVAPRFDMKRLCASDKGLPFGMTARCAIAAGSSFPKT